jgi:2'-5' RNA ligase
MRSFVALGLPAGLRGSLADLAGDLEAGHPVPEENLHLTLAFLDDQPGNVLGDLHDLLGAIRAPVVPVAVEGLGCFGGRNPRTLHAEVRETPELAGLQRKVAGAARDCGIEIERRRFRPHVTLVRFGPRLAPGEAARLDGFLGIHAGSRFEAVEVDAFGLYASTLTKAGPVYDLLAEYPLGAA